MRRTQHEGAGDFFNQQEWVCACGFHTYYVARWESEASRQIIIPQHAPCGGFMVPKYAPAERDTVQHLVALNRVRLDPRDRAIGRKTCAEEFEDELHDRERTQASVSAIKLSLRLRRMMP